LSNVIAFGALLAWPLVTLLLILAMSTRQAIVWSLLAGYLLLPGSTAFSLQGVPDLDKTTIPNIATFLFAMALARRGEFRWPRGFAVNLLLLAYVVSPLLTGLANRDPIATGDVVRPAMTLYDSVSFMAYHLFDVFPFILGAGFLRDENSHREMLLIFVGAALAYSLPILAEIRLSPQLAMQIYGISDPFFFIQNMRGSGFRAMVFLGHGLLIAIFLAMGLMAAAGLWRQRRPVWGLPAALVVAFLAAVLVLNKSAGSLIISLVLVPAFLLLPARRFLTLAAVIATIVFAYPLLRSADLIPTSGIEQLTARVDPDRAASFAFRVTNEDQLLERARERYVLGWGGWARNRIFISNWAGQFSDASVTDGTWIVTIGTSGWVGYIALFGLITYPVWRCYGMRKRAVPIASVALVGMLTLNLVDLVPNSSLRPITWLIAGALTGLVVQPVRQKGKVAAKGRRVAPDFSKLKPATA
jgi:hypothetical protein